MAVTMILVVNQTSSDVFINNLTTDTRNGPIYSASWLDNLGIPDYDKGSLGINSIVPVRDSQNNLMGYWFGGNYWNNNIENNAAVWAYRDNTSGNITAFYLNPPLNAVDPVNPGNYGTGSSVSDMRIEKVNGQNILRFNIGPGEASVEINSDSTPNLNTQLTLGDAGYDQTLPSPTPASTPTSSVTPTVAEPTVTPTAEATATATPAFTVTLGPKSTKINRPDIIFLPAVSNNSTSEGW